MTVGFQQQQIHGQVRPDIINVQNDGDDGDTPDLDNVAKHDRGQLFRRQR